MKQLFIVFTLVVFCLIYGCKDPFDDAPKATIAAFSPDFGQAGDTITITGTNFPSNAADIRVTFGNDKVATLVSQSSTEIKIKTPSGSKSGAVSMKLGDKTYGAGDFTFYSLYLYGTIKRPDNYPMATYWRDGILAPISTRRSVIVDVIKDGSDVHAIGLEETDLFVFRAAYWKNGVKIPLEGVKDHTRYTCITIVNNDVYVGGDEKMSDIMNTEAMYWKNGARIVLETNTFTTVNDIQVDGNDVYVAGSKSFRAGYWKNGEFIRLANPNHCDALAITIKGGDVYAAGILETIEGTHAMFWKNDTSLDLTTFDEDPFTNQKERASCLCLVGSDVLVGGSRTFSTYDIAVFTPMYWLNGMPNPIESDAFGHRVVNSIAEFRGVIFKLVTTDGSSDAPGYIYRNNDLILTTAVGTHIHGLFVMPY